MRVTQLITVGLFAFVVVVPLFVEAASCARSCNTSCPNSQPVINVVDDCGATGNGVTDDTLCFQDAASCAPTSTSGTLYVPTGTFLLNEQVSLNSNTTLLCESWASILKWGSPDDAIRTMVGFVEKRNVRIIGCHLDGDRSGESEFITTAIGVGDSSEFIIENNWIHDFSNSAVAVNNTSHSGIIRNNLAENLEDNVIELIGTGVTKITITGNTINVNTASPNAGCIELDNGASNIIVTNNICQNSHEVGIQAEQSVTHSIIANNIVLGTTGRTQSCIKVEGEERGEGSWVLAKGVVVANNIVTDCTLHGIQVDHARETAVIGNIAFGNYMHGITAADSRYISIIGNVSYNNSQGASVTNGDAIAIEVVRNSTVIGNICVDGQSPTTQDRGIHQTAGVHNVIVGNACANNTNGDYAITSSAMASMEVAHNVGYQHGYGPLNLTVNSSNPSVGGIVGGTAANLFKTANTSATTISSFSNGKSGQRIVIIINDSNTDFDFTGSSLKGNGGTDWTSADIGDHLECVLSNHTDKWYCSVYEN